MTQVVPPEWRFLFITTPKMMDKMDNSSAIQQMLKIGKLRTENVERWTSQWKDKATLDLREIRNRLLTNSSFYDEQLKGVDNLLIFTSSSIICANSMSTVNDFLQYDWVGAPW